MKKEVKIPVPARRAGYGRVYSPKLLANNTIKSRKSVYISREAFDIALGIVNIFPEKGMSLSGYIDAIVKHHFEFYKVEINRLYERELQKLTNKKLIE